MSKQCIFLKAKANHTYLYAVVNAVYRCTGDEASLSQCESTPGGGLGHERDVGVECRRPTPCSNPLVIMSMYMYMYIIIISSPTACIAYLLYIVETVYVVKAALSVLPLIVEVEAVLSVVPIDWFPSMFADAFDGQQS